MFALLLFLFLFFFGGGQKRSQRGPGPRIRDKSQVTGHFGGRKGHQAEDQKTSGFDVSANFSEWWFQRISRNGGLHFCFQRNRWCFYGLPKAPRTTTCNKQKVAQGYLPIAVLCSPDLSLYSPRKPKSLKRRWAFV